MLTSPLRVPKSSSENLELKFNFEYERIRNSWGMKYQVTLSSVMQGRIDGVTSHLNQWGKILVDLIKKKQKKTHKSVKCNPVNKKQVKSNNMLI